MKKLFLIAAVLLTGCCGRSDVSLDLIPAPRQVERSCGEYSLPERLTVACGDSLFLAARDFLAHALPGTELAAPTLGNEGDVVLALDGSLGEGAYRLRVASDGVRIAAGSYGGAISAIATLRQLAAAGGGATVPAVEIEDAPRYAWRGCMLDVARHFFTKEQVKALLLRMAEYKFNKFHWHLTDDQGWRIEIRRYPALTEQGAWRDPATHGNDITCAERAEETLDPAYRLPEELLRTDGEGRTLYGGCYTQEEIREVVAYAATLGIDVIPELDMPGHSLKIIESFPALSCAGKAAWGETFSTPLCLGNDATLEFAKNVYEEVFELFPFEYVHLGADEVEKSAWTNCPKCQSRIRMHRLGDEHGLQAWFVREMESFFAAHGRKLIGWDEIAGDNLSPTAVVQWWRSWMGSTLTQSLEAGNSVILSPVEYLYLDGTQNRNSLLKVYGYDPAAERIAGRESQVLGLHANLWTETVPTFDRACYQIFPRLFAASELAWSTQPKDAAGFERRAAVHMQRLDAEGWNYRIPDLGGFCDENVFLDRTVVEVVKPFGSVVVRYTTDGSVPTASSPLYEGPITVDADCTLMFRRFTASGKAGDTQRAHFVKSSLLAPTETGRTLSPGLTVRWYDYVGEACGEIESATLRSESVAASVAIPEQIKGNIGLVFTGYLDIPEDGIYSFYLYTDDGSTLKIDGRMVVDNDGPHSRTERSGQIALARGLHPVEIRYFDSNGGILEAGMIDAQGRRVPIPSQMLRH